MATLVPTQVLVWNTKKPGKRLGVAYSGGVTDTYLLNSNRIIEMRPLTADTVRFFFANDPDDPRDAPDYIECTNSLATWETAHTAIVPTSKFADLPIFPGGDITVAHEHVHVEWENIAYAYATKHDHRNSRCHVVYYTKDWKRVEALLDMSWTALWVQITA